MGRANRGKAGGAVLRESSSGGASAPTTSSVETATFSADNLSHHESSESFRRALGDLGYLDAPSSFGYTAENGSVIFSRNSGGKVEGAAGLLLQSSEKIPFSDSLHQKPLLHGLRANQAAISFQETDSPDNYEALVRRAEGEALSAGKKELLVAVDPGHSGQIASLARAGYGASSYESGDHGEVVFCKDLQGGGASLGDAPRFDRIHDCKAKEGNFTHLNGGKNLKKLEGFDPASPLTFSHFTHDTPWEASPGQTDAAPSMEKIFGQGRKVLGVATYKDKNDRSVTTWQFSPADQGGEVLPNYSEASLGGSFYSLRPPDEIMNGAGSTHDAFYETADKLQSLQDSYNGLLETEKARQSSSVISPSLEMRASEEERRTREALRESKAQLDSYISIAAREGAYFKGEGNYREAVERVKNHFDAIDSYLESKRNSR